MSKYAFPYLDKYKESFIENNGVGEAENCLPMLVVYFRVVFETMLHIDPPSFFRWNEEVTEDFDTWGYNSRWSHTFRYMLKNHLNLYVRKLKKLMRDNKIEDFCLAEYPEH